jgi:hypothetical protein
MKPSTLALVFLTTSLGLATCQPSGSGGAFGDVGEGPPIDGVGGFGGGGGGAGGTTTCLLDTPFALSTPLDYMIGVDCGVDPTCPAKVEGWLERPLDVVGASISTTGWISTAPFAQTMGGAPLLECAFPLLSVSGETNDLDDMAQAASGGYDAAYTDMAKALAAWPNPLLSVRIGWEANGDHYTWSNGVGTNATYANYVAAFKRAAAIVKQYNPHALVEWSLAWGRADPTPYWPGAYDATGNPGGVDVISMDVYQADVTQIEDAGAPLSWALAQGGEDINLDWMTDFAQQQGVKVALSEYAAGNSASMGADTGRGADDGTWTMGAIQWMNGQPPGFFLWATWSGAAPADDIITPCGNYDEQQEWVDMWRYTKFAGTWWGGAAAP